MAKRATDQKDFSHPWYLWEWMEQAGKKQADMVRELGWSRAKASDLMAGQQYNQGHIDELSSWLHVRPFELLLHPAEAMALRRLREDAARIVESEPGLPRTGTAG
jgi:predicted XRE-type DNA-binding protein